MDLKWQEIGVTIFKNLKKSMLDERQVNRYPRLLIGVVEF